MGLEFSEPVYPSIFQINTRVWPTDLAQANVDALKVTNWINATDPAIDGKKIALQPYEISRSLAVAPDAADKHEPAGDRRLRERQRAFEHLRR